ncbi:MULTISPECIES: T9SS type A sorting domain-containing protein [Flavobacterium]|uniref:T9SS type A sorting domain-containing protein n=1 Tax=Flavobacterium keumense TaxID=1306518 RepID=A0ABY8N6J8_9FLAO|nr:MULTISPECIES: T9SS type A sorting domain-containing protein [Flavobacterium]WGK94758.1 T9SS type A sorting domain-containing protein [Flavobacterium keumense]
MKKLLLLLFFSNSYSQGLHHQAISSMGTSFTTPGGIYVSQTIGQIGALSSFANPKFYVQQGFQQSLAGNNSLSVSKKDIESESVVTKMFPNPVDTDINFEFSKDINGDLSVSIFNISGRVIYSGIITPIDRLAQLKLSGIFSPGYYLIQLSSMNSKYKYTNKFLKL